MPLDGTTSNQLLTDLRALRELLSDEPRWAQRVFVEWRQSLYAFCLMGGAFFVTTKHMPYGQTMASVKNDLPDDWGRYETLLDRLRHAVPHNTISLTGFNDHSSHKDVLDFLDGVILKEMEKTYAA